MNLEDIKTLRDLYQLAQSGVITEEEFGMKKKEFLSSISNTAPTDKIKLLQELHQLMQEGIISQEEFNAKKQELLNSKATPTAPTPISTNEDHQSSTREQAQTSYGNSSNGFSVAGIEKTLNELNIDGLNMKITNDKLYINSATSNETFALRSVNGIGIVDLVEKYNKELEAFKANRFKPYIFAGILFVMGVAILSDLNILFGIILIIVGITIAIIAQNNTKEPSIQSAVRVMLNGMNRDFEFNKKSAQSSSVAKFVALVEDTLTAYHKNN